MSVAASPSGLELRMLRSTSLVAAIVAFALVVWGAIVRINGAGMTCPDWPRCRGAWFPALSDSVVYEWTHRYGAAVLTLLIVATFVAAWRARSASPRAWQLSWVAAGLVVAQIVVGALTIRYINSPPSVAAHLALGVATFTSLLLVWYAAGAGAPAPGGPLAFSRVCLAALVATLFAIVAAGYMSAAGAGSACAGLPLCNGWGPAVNGAQQIHMVHRLLAYFAFALALIAGISGVRTQTARGTIGSLALTALVLATLQVALGAATVVSGLAPVLRSLHEANGALLFAILALLTYAAYWTAPAAATPVVPERSSGTGGVVGPERSSGTGGVVGPERSSGNPA